MELLESMELMQSKWSDEKIKKLSRRSLSRNEGRKPEILGLNAKKEICTYKIAFVKKTD